MDVGLNREFSAQQHLSAMMWTLLILGAVITTGFMFFFGLEDFRIQLIMTGLLAGYLSFMLYLVFSLDHIFTGPQGIKPVMFEKVVQVFNELDREEPDRPSSG
jgi:ABC-type branched-subunit amino acid transport system permease subunit